MADYIDRQAAIAEVHSAIYEFFDICDDDEESPMTYKDDLLLDVNKAITTQIKAMPSAQPERLTDDDFETIRIHLNAYKEKLGNQYRWREAEEYQRIIDRFMAFASAQPEIVRCKDCKYSSPNKVYGCRFEPFDTCENGGRMYSDDYCSRAERRTDE